MKKALIFTMFFCVATAFATQKIPFITLRLMSSSTEDIEYSKRLIESVKNYPNTFDDVWLCAMSQYYTIKQIEEGAKNVVDKVAKMWEDAGIEAGYQIGLTLGHGGESKNFYGFTPEDYRMRPNGSRQPSLCVNSPKVREYFHDSVKALVANSRIKNVWLDDDFRIGFSYLETCFCKRCLDRFNKENKTSYSITEIVDVLTNNKQNSPEIRKKWLDCQFKALAEVAGSARAGRDAGNPNCRIALQSIHPLKYNYHDYPTILDGFAGKNGKTGIRIGSGYYDEFDSKDYYLKLLGVMYEANRCSRKNNLFQICYEAENYPHISMQKTPRAMMLECSTMLAAGCDSLTLYWHDVNYSEPQADYENFAKVVSAWRPYFEKVAKLNKDTRLYGVGRFIGSAKYKGNQTRCLPDSREYNLLLQGIPVICTDTVADYALITPDTAQLLSDEELKMLLSKNCVADAQTVELLQKRGFKFPAKISIKNYAFSLFGSDIIEMNKGEKFRVRGPARFLDIDKSKAKEISSLVDLNGKYVSSAFAVCQTEQGGKIFIVGGNGIVRYPTAYRRAAFLDALDAMAPMAVRLETSHNIIFMPRVDANGEFAGATFYNDTKGDTGTLTLRVRAKAPAKYKLVAPKQNDIVLESKLAKNGDGYILSLPNLAPVSVYTIVRAN